MIPAFGPMPRAAFLRCCRAKRWQTRVRRIRKIAGAIPLALVLPFTWGIVRIEGQDQDAHATLFEMCPPGEAHTWHGEALLVEQRYANDLVEALRGRGVFVP